MLIKQQEFLLSDQRTGRLLKGLLTQVQKAS
jgi:hypothetical protein